MAVVIQEKYVCASQCQVYAIITHPFECFTSCLWISTVLLLLKVCLLHYYFACRVVIRLKDLILQAAEYLLCCAVHPQFLFLEALNTLQDSAILEMYSKCFCNSLMKVTIVYGSVRYNYYYSGIVPVTSIPAFYLFFKNYRNGSPERRRFFIPLSSQTFYLLLVCLCQKMILPTFLKPQEVEEFH